MHPIEFFWILSAKRKEADAKSRGSGAFTAAQNEEICEDESGEDSE